MENDITRALSSVCQGGRFRFTAPGVRASGPRARASGRTRVYVPLCVPLCVFIIRTFIDSPAKRATVLPGWRAVALYS
jgi:hypothetical protein